MDFLNIPDRFMKKESPVSEYLGTLSALRGYRIASFAFAVLAVFSAIAERLSLIIESGYEYFGLNGLENILYTIVVGALICVQLEKTKKYESSGLLLLFPILIMTMMQIVRLADYSRYGYELYVGSFVGNYYVIVMLNYVMVAIGSLKESSRRVLYGIARFSFIPVILCEAFVVVMRAVTRADGLIYHGLRYHWTGVFEGTMFMFMSFALMFAVCATYKREEIVGDCDIFGYSITMKIYCKGEKMCQCFDDLEEKRLFNEITDAEYDEKRREMIQKL